MTAPSKEELRVRLVELERHYSLAYLAVKIGWIPFVLLGFPVAMLSIAQIWDDSQNTLDDSSVILILGLIVFGLVAFYSLVFRRVAKLSAEISATKILLSFDTSKEL
jgi:hypothetical protein